jgi:pimeloyl-ACP methyl ester carboxylesterase
LVLSTTPLMPKQELAQLASANVGQPEMAADGSHLVKAWAGRQGVWGRDLDRRILHAATSDIAAVYDRFHWGLIAVMNCDVGRLLERVACPSLFLTGALDAHVAHNEAAARVVRGSRYELLAQATAPISATQPKAYAERVLRFVHGDGAS